MVGKIVAGLIFPGLLVILFTRVTYSYLVGVLLTIALIVVSAYKGYTNAWPVIIVDAISITIGLWYSKRMVVKFHPEKE